MSVAKGDRPLNGTSNPPQGCRTARAEQGQRPGNPAILRIRPCRKENKGMNTLIVGIDVGYPPMTCAR